MLTERLVITGSYRYVRNPMYVAIVSAVVGQALLLGQSVLLMYALVLWGWLSRLRCLVRRAKP